MSRTLAKEWAAYREMVVPENASETQVTVMHQTFHAGAAAVLAMLSEEADAADVPRRLLEVALELSAFCERVVRS